ncbi:MAG: glycoside hydrolase family 3 protein [Clostridia bacterium]|nr:glycoside hydrolase family 3 protein [Clostridia bacterium]
MTEADKRSEMALSAEDAQKIETLLLALTPAEKAALVTGTEFMCTNPVPRLGIPALRMADGPHGLRKQEGKQNNGTGGSIPATVFPTAVTVAAGFRPENARRLGEALADECRALGVHLLLGPGANIKRNPRCGRNFEYYSEDPLLAAEMAAGEIRGLQSHGVGAVVKHFAANNSENFRIFGDSVLSERALHEIYLAVFRGILEKASPVSVMCSYNRVRGEYVSESGALLGILKDAWGYEGMVMTDWGATHNRPQGLVAGVDLEMPGDNLHSRHALLAALAAEAEAKASEGKAASAQENGVTQAAENEEKTAAEGSETDAQENGVEQAAENEEKTAAASPETDAQENGVTQAAKDKERTESADSVGEALNEAVRRVLRTVYRVHRHYSPLATLDAEAHHALAADIAADAAVLLKNEGIFPLRAGKRRLVVGELFTRLRYQGAGSSMGAPLRLCTVKEAYDKREADYRYALGYRLDEEEGDGALVTEALAAAKEVDEILFFGGLSDSADSESADRPHISLRENQLTLLDALLATGKPVGVVLYGGGVTELPFAHRAAGILHMLLPGQNGGEATARLLFGERSPAGRLPETFVRREADIPYNGDFGKYPAECYREDVYVGYRFYALHPERVLYPFGYGLSYTAFAAGDFSLSVEGERAVATYRLRNVGERRGAEVMQLYVLPPKDGAVRAPITLVAFEKTDLDPGEEGTVTLSFPLSRLAVYDKTKGRLVIPQGEYTLVFGKNARDAWASLPFFVEGEVCAAEEEPFDGVYREGRIEEISREAFLEAYPHHRAKTEKEFTIDTALPEMKKRGLAGRLVYGLMYRFMTADGRRAKHMKSSPEKRNMVKGAEFGARILETATLRFISTSSGGLLPYTAAVAIAHLVNGRVLGALGALLWREKAPPLPERSRKRRKNPPPSAPLP